MPPPPLPLPLTVMVMLMLQVLLRRLELFLSLLRVACGLYGGGMLRVLLRSLSVKGLFFSV